MRRLLVLLAILGFMLFTTSCQKPAEGLVAKYFQVMGMSDKDSMTSMAVIPMEIEFEKYEITSSTEPVKKELSLPGLLAEFKEIDKQRRDFAIQASNLNSDILDLEDEKEEARSRRKKKEIDDKIADLKEQKKQVEIQYRDVLIEKMKLRKKIEREKKMLSMCASIKENHEKYEGVSTRAEVFVDVTLPNKGVKKYVFIMLSYDLKENGEKKFCRMIVEKIFTQAEYEKYVQKQQGGEQKVTPDETQTTEEVTEKQPVKKEGEKVEQKKEEKK